jgi:hypothetical protein
MVIQSFSLHVMPVLKSDLQVQAANGCHRSEYDIHKHFLVDQYNI